MNDLQKHANNTANVDNLLKDLVLRLHDERPWLHQFDIFKKSKEAYAFFDKKNISESKFSQSFYDDQIRLIYSTVNAFLTSIEEDFDEREIGENIAHLKIYAYPDQSYSEGLPLMMAFTFEYNQKISDSKRTFGFDARLADILMDYKIHMSSLISHAKKYIQKIEKDNEIKAKSAADEVLLEAKKELEVKTSSAHSKAFIYPLYSVNSLNELAQPNSRDKVGGWVKSFQRIANREMKAIFPCGHLVQQIEWLSELRRDFPNFVEYFDFLEQQITLSSLTSEKSLALHPTLFVGEAGIGKTELINRLSRCFYKKVNIEGVEVDYDSPTKNVLQINMASAQTSSALSGSSSYWSNSHYGDLFKLLMFSDFLNPMVFLDELDKVVVRDYNPVASLYQLLEKNDAKAFYDLALTDLAIDASHVNWFASANSINPIDEAILSRFNVFNIPMPTAAQTRQVMKSVYRGILNDAAWGERFAPELSEDVLDSMKNLSGREVKLMLTKAAGIAAIDGRNEIAVKDLSATTKKQQMGFSLTSTS